MQANVLSAVGVATRLSAKQSIPCDAQGWQVLTPQKTSFFAAVNLPMLDFHSRTGPEADFNSGMQSHQAPLPDRRMPFRSACSRIYW